MYATSVGCGEVERIEWKPEALDLKPGGRVCHGFREVDGGRSSLGCRALGLLGFGLMVWGLGFRV